MLESPTNPPNLNNPNLSSDHYLKTEGYRQNDEGWGIVNLLALKMEERGDNLK